MLHISAGKQYSRLELSMFLRGVLAMPYSSCPSDIPHPELYSSDPVFRSVTRAQFGRTEHFPDGDVVHTRKFFSHEKHRKTQKPLRSQRHREQFDRRSGGAGFRNAKLKARGPPTDRKPICDLCQSSASAFLPFHPVHPVIRSKAFS
jgi:hypothetical protein